MRLTEREIQVKNLTELGLSQRQIALELKISEQTVKIHCRNMRQKGAPAKKPAYGRTVVNGHRLVAAVAECISIYGSVDFVRPVLVEVLQRGLSPHAQPLTAHEALQKCATIVEEHRKNEE